MKPQEKFKNKIIIEDKQIELLISNWLGFYENSASTRLITDSFSMALNLIGLNHSESYFLNNYNDSTKSFDCKACDSDELVSIALNLENDRQFLIIVGKDYRNTYEFYNKKEKFVKLRKSSKFNKYNKNTCRYILSESCNYFTLDNEEYSLYISLKSKEDAKIDSNIVTMLENYLSSLTLPINIFEAYECLCNIINSLDKFSNIIISIEKHENRTTLNTGMIVIQDGNIESFYTQDNNKSIKLLRNGDWEYQHAEVLDNRNKNKGNEYNEIKDEIQALSRKLFK